MSATIVPRNAVNDEHLSELDTEPVFAEADRFLDALDKEATQFTFQTFAESANAKARGVGAQILHGTVGDLWPALCRLHGNGSGVFVTINETNGRGRETDDITRVRAVFVDIDSDDVECSKREAAMACGLEPHIVVESSPGKTHAYWLVDGLQDHQFHAVQKSIAARFGGDESICDLARVMRLPGFWHRKPKNDAPFRTRIIITSGAQPYSADRILAESPPLAAVDTAERQPVPAARQGSPHAAMPSTITAEKVVDLRSALACIPADDRVTWIAMGAALRGLGDQGRGLWIDWSQGSGKWKPTDAQDWETIRHDHTGYGAVFAEAQRRGWSNPRSTSARLAAADARVGDMTGMMAAAVPVAGSSARRGFQLVPISEMLAAPRPISWLVRRHLPLDALALIHGAPSAGKSFVAMDMTFCVVTATPWHGNEVRAMPSIYLAGEGVGGVARRACAWEIANGKSLSDSKLVVSKSPAILDNPAAMTEVHAAISAAVDGWGEPPGLVVVDTVARSMEGDENSTPDMNRLVAAMTEIRTRWGCCVLAVHHSGKAEGSELVARGSIALPAGVDTHYVVLRNGEDVRTLRSIKEKDYEKPADKCFMLQQVALPSEWNDEYGDASTSAVLIPADASSASGPVRMTEPQASALAVMRELAGESGRVSCEALSVALGARGTIPDRRRRHAVLNQLVTKGAMIRRGDDYFCPDRLAERVDFTSDTATVH